MGLMQGSDLQLKVFVDRDKDFVGAIEVQPDWLPPGVSHEPAVTIPAGKNQATIKIQANDKAAPGVYKVAMNATTTAGDSASVVATIANGGQVMAPYLSIELQRTSVERGKRGEIVGVVKVNRTFEGKAKITLQQLPRGVKQVGAAEISAKDKDVVLHIEADADALAGLYKGVTCEVEFQDFRNAGETVRSKTGSGVLRVDLPRSL